MLHTCIKDLMACTAETHLSLLGAATGRRTGAPTSCGCFDAWKELSELNLPLIENSL